MEELPPFDLGVSAIAPEVTATYFFKFKFAGSTFRTSASGESYDELVDSIRARIKVAPGTGLVLTYKDDDEDDIELGCDEELQDAVALAEDLGWRTIKLAVAVSEAPRSFIDSFAQGGNSSFNDSSIRMEGNMSSASAAAAVEVPGAGAEDRGNEALRDSQFEAAAKAFTLALEEVTAVSDVPSALRLHSKLATVHSILGAHEDALGACDAGLSLADNPAAGPDAPQARKVCLATKAEILLETGRYEAAVASLFLLPSGSDAFTELLAKFLEEKDELKADGSSCFAEREYVDAMSLYNSALRIVAAIHKENEYPLDHTLYANRGACYVHMGDFEQAEGDYTKALEINPEFVKGYVGLGKLLFESRGADAADPVVARGMALAPDVPALIELKEKIEGERIAADVTAAMEAAAAMAAQAEAEAEAKAKAEAEAKAKAEAEAEAEASQDETLLSLQLQNLMSMASMAAMTSAAVVEDTSLSPDTPRAEMDDSVCETDISMRDASLSMSMMEEDSDPCTTPLPSTPSTPTPRTTTTTATAASPSAAGPSSLSKTLELLAERTRVLADQIGDKSKENASPERTLSTSKTSAPSTPVLSTRRPMGSPMSEGLSAQLRQLNSMTAALCMATADLRSPEPRNSGTPGPNSPSMEGSPLVRLARSMASRSPSRTPTHM